jgi:hypothetical protein
MTENIPVIKDQQFEFISKKEHLSKEDIRQKIAIELDMLDAYQNNIIDIFNINSENIEE